MRERRNQAVAIEYLRWLRRVETGRWLLLIWDVHTAHRKAEVKEETERQNIALLYIPAGMTDKMQLLDYRIFGSLKQRAQAQVRWGSCQQGITDEFHSLRIMLEVWRNMDEDEIRHVGSLHRVPSS
jgi:hypothetical protein